MGRGLEIRQNSLEQDRRCIRVLIITRNLSIRRLYVLNMGSLGTDSRAAYEGLDADQLSQLRNDRGCGFAPASHATGQANMRFQDSLVAVIQNFKARHGVSQIAVLLAAVQSSMHRLTSVENNVIRVLNTDRNQQATFHHAMQLEKWIQVRGQSDEDQSYETCVRRIQQELDEAMPAPPDAHSEGASFVRDESLTNAPGRFAVVTHGKHYADKSEASFARNLSRFDLEFHFSRDVPLMYGHVLYSEHLFNVEAIQNVIDVFLEVLKQGLSMPEMPIADLPLAGLVSASCQHKLAHIRRSKYPRDSSIVDLFLEQAQKHSAIVAVTDDSTQLTYTELDRKSNILAGWLVSQVLPSQSLVSVFMPRSCYTVVAFLGILKAGLAYLPLDVDAPADRIAAILATIPSSDILVVLEDDVPMPKLGGLSHIRTILVVNVVQQVIDASSNAISAITHLSPAANSLAYVMFTSGSTGKPKGVMVEHRGVIRLVRQSNVTSHLQPGAKVSHLATIAFDASTWEIYTALLNGGTLVCLPKLTVLDPIKLQARFKDEQIAAAKFPPVLLQQYINDAPKIFDSLRVLLSSGDRLQPELAQRVLKAFQGRMYNAYGPTESTGHSTCFELQRNGEALPAIIPIGRAIDDSGAIVVDSKQRLVPRGVLGELLLTGDGLARGYLDSSQDKDRFINIRINGKVLRAYRTGDRVRRRLVDGELEFLGRLDHQVKVRGYRIELGEIEHALLRNGSVENAVTLLHDDGRNEPRLAAFLTLKVETDADDQGGRNNNADENEEVQAWADIRQSVVYADLQSIDPTCLGRDFVGWVSMYDGQKIDEAEMEEWLQDTLKTLLGTCDTRNVLEIGTGTGMMMFNLPDVQTYRGVEPVRRAAEFVMGAAASIPRLAGRVEVKIAAADDVLSKRDFTLPTTVIINSVAQYFPSPEYFHEIISHLLRSKGVQRIFIGDIRSFALYKEFQVTMAEYHSKTGGDRANLREYLDQFAESEKELLIDPGFFTSFKDTHADVVHHVEILPKRMKATNELSCYRYTAVIHVKCPQAPSCNIQSIGRDEWTDFVAKCFNASTLSDHLAQNRKSTILAVSNIPNRKTYAERAILDDTILHTGQIGEWRSFLHNLRRSEVKALSAMEVINIGEAYGFQVELSYARQSSQRGAFDAVFHKERASSAQTRLLYQFPTDHQGRSPRSFTNRPLQHRHKRRVEHALKRELQTVLPPYMIPAVITVLEKMPINQNKKVDRQALLAMLRDSSLGSQVSEIVAPRSDTERAICEEYTDILGQEVGITSNFFDLGGHSLMATRVVSRINRRLNIGVTIRDIFECPVVEDLAGRIQPLVGQMPYMAIPRLTHKAAVQQSFAQSRLWFLEQFYPESTRYLMPHGFRLRGSLSLTALQSALNALETRHETLRTVFAEENGVDLQIVLDPQPRELRLIEVLPDEVPSLATMIEKEQVQPFDLRHEPGWRVAVFRINDEDHVLSIVLHHIVSDGWSMELLRNELGSFYSAALHGGDPLAQAPGLSVQYRDFSVWQREGSQAARHEKELEYWITQLEGSQAAEFISDYARPSQLSGTAGQTSFVLSPSTLSNLQELARKSQITPYTIFLSAFKAAHFYVTGVEDANIGTLTANRHRQELEGLIGFFVNLQAIRSTTRGDMSFAALIEIMRGITAAAIENQDAPFEMIVANAKLTNRDPSRNPLVQVTFALHCSQGTDQLNIEGVDVELMSRSERTRFDVELHLYQNELGIRGHALYADDLFHAATIQNVVDIFLEVLEQGLKAPETPIMELPLASRAASPLDCKPLDIEHPSYPRGSSIVDVFRQQAASVPTVVAVKDSSLQLTYAQLDEQSDRLAYWLSKQELPAESLVGVFMPRSCQTIVTFLGILKAGLAYLPLDINAPRGRIEAILAIIPSSKTLVLEHEISMPRQEGTDRIQVISFQGAISQVTGDDIDFAAIVARSQPSATSLAYVMFTSGSTGAPKGVMIEHHGVVRLVRQPAVISHLKPGAKVAHLATIAFDASTWEIYTAILNASTLICLDVMTVLDPIKLRNRFQEEQINIAKFTPVLLRQCLDRVPDLFGSVDLLLSAGDRLTPTLAAQALSHTTAEFFNAYGPTENTGFSTIYHVQRSASLLGTIPIGRPLIGSGVIVADAKQHALNPGVVGELVVFGDGLARGYLDPTQNRDRFVELSFGNEMIRAYRTSDRVRQRPLDGEIEFLGRIDHQVKIRGYRVELGEVESVLLSNSLVHDAVALICEHGSNEPRLVALITLVPGQLSPGVENADSEKAKVTSQVRKLVEGRLPSYMVPSTIGVLEQMPVNSNRKVDRPALQKMAAGLKESRPVRELVRARNETEQVICEEFAAALATDVSITDNFFDLGGHSLMAIRVASRIFRRLNCDLSIFQFYQAAAPIELANAISMKRDPGASAVDRLPAHILDFHRKESRATLVLIHGFWGQGNAFLPLVAQIQDHLDVILVHDPFFWKPEGPSSLAEWASFYLNDLKKVIRQDLPVILGGFSFGGLIAYQMAAMWTSVSCNPLASILLLDAGSHPALSRFLANKNLPQKSLDHALAVFGDEQRPLVCRHFEKYRSLNMCDIENYRYEGDGLYLVTPESSSATWWNTHCPNISMLPVDCSHYGLLESHMAGPVAETINKHYQALFA